MVLSFVADKIGEILNPYPEGQVTNTMRPYHRYIVVIVDAYASNPRLGKRSHKLTAQA